MSLLLPLVLLLGCSNAPEPSPQPGPDPVEQPAPQDPPVAAPEASYQPATWQTPEGEGVALVGTVLCSDDVLAGGTLRVEFRSGEAGQDELVHGLALEGAGAWNAQAPADAGALSVFAYVDRDGSGYTLGEPVSAHVQISVEQAALSGLDLAVVGDPIPLQEPATDVAMGPGMVTLTGTVTTEQPHEGQIVVNLQPFMDPPLEQPPFSEQFDIAGLGPFEIAVKENLGKVVVGALVHGVDKGGPPSLLAQPVVLEIGTEPIQDVTLELMPPDQIVE